MAAVARVHLRGRGLRVIASVVVAGAGAGAVVVAMVAGVVGVVEAARVVRAAVAPRAGPARERPAPIH